MHIKEAAEACRLPPDTIRFYERRGVLPTPPRAANGYRHYTEEHIETLRLAKGLRELGLPLAEVAPIVRVSHDGTCREVRERMIATFAEALHDLDAKIDELAAARDRVAELLRGLKRMRSKDVSVPGVAACKCVQLVATPGTARGRAGRG